MADNVVVTVPEKQIIAGRDGFDPIIESESILGGTRVWILGRSTMATFQVMDGTDGLSAYEQAVRGGYEGTEAQFNQELRSFKTLSEQAATSAESAAAAQEAAETAQEAAEEAQGAAESSATAASESASAADASATGATLAATNASASASNAATSASAASSYASNAASSATAASGSAGSASASATAAASAQSAAEAAQSAAATSASSASSSATAAGNAQSAAETAQGAAETAAQSVSQSAAQIGQNAADITDLKSVIKTITGNELLGGWSENHKYIITNGAAADINTPATTTSNLHYMVIPCLASDQFTITCSGGIESRAYAFVSSDGTILEVAPVNATLTNFVVTAPENAENLIVNDSSLVGTVYYGKYIRDIASDIDAALKDTQKTIADALEGNVITFTGSIGGTRKFPYIFYKGNNYSCKNETGAYTTINLFHKDGTMLSLGQVANGASVDFVPESSGYVAIGGYFNGSGSLILTVLGVYPALNALDARLDVVEPKVTVAEAELSDLSNLESMNRIVRDMSFNIKAFSIIDGYRNNGGNIGTSDAYKSTPLIPVKAGQVIRYKLSHWTTFPIICYYTTDKQYDSEKSVIGENGYSEGTYTVSGDGYLSFTFAISKDNVDVKFTDDIPISVKQYVDDHIPAGNGIKNLKILFIGDSILGMDGQIVDDVALLTGATVTNGAISGTRAIVRGNESYGYLDGPRIVNALCTGVWTDQEAAAEAVSSSDPKVPIRIAAMKAITFSEIDLIVMNYGTNDYTAGNALSAITESYNNMINQLQQTNPSMRILILSPIWRYFGTIGESNYADSDSQTFGHETLKVISEGIVTFCKNRRISTKNMYEEMPLSQYTAATYFDYGDKTHLNATGNLVYAHIVNGKLNSMY